MIQDDERTNGIDELRRDPHENSLLFGLELSTHENYKLCYGVELYQIINYFTPWGKT
jgi:hypothetical protein